MAGSASTAATVTTAKHKVVTTTEIFEWSETERDWVKKEKTVQTVEEDLKPRDYINDYWNRPQVPPPYSPWRWPGGDGRPVVTWQV